MNLEHINTAIEVMEEVRDRKLPFDIRQYQEGANFEDRCTKHTLSEAVSCGTACCFSGYLAVHPKVQAQGGSVGPIGQLLYKNHDYITQFSGIVNMARYLGISGGEAEKLIYSFGYGHFNDEVNSVTPQDVLEKLYALRDRAQQELLSA